MEVSLASNLYSYISNEIIASKSTQHDIDLGSADLDLVSYVLLLESLWMQRVEFLLLTAEIIESRYRSINI